MLVKVELHRVVVRFLRHECSGEARRAFYEALERLRGDPIGFSEAIHDPTVSPYILRFFRFDDYIALFQSNRNRDKILIRLCRKRTPP